jgi:lactoylglutathione lyase
MPRINHVALKVTDLEAATRFYENVFGFRQVGTGRSRGHISRHLTDGYVDLALMVYDSEEDEEAKLVGNGPAIHHFGIEVDDRRRFIEKIEANGGTLLSKPDERTVKFRSPDGTIAEIVDVGRYAKMRTSRPELRRAEALHRRRA